MKEWCIDESIKDDKIYCYDKSKVIVKQNTLKRDIIINNIRISSCITGEYFNIKCPICKEENKK